MALTVVRRYAKGREEALEYLNVGMMKVFDVLGQFRWEGSLEGWIKTVVFRSTIDEFRSRRQRPTVEIADWDEATESGAIRDLYADDLVRIIDLLPEPTREVFWLYAVEGYQHQEIAARLGFTTGNSRWHLNKARTLLKEKLATTPFKHNRYAG